MNILISFISGVWLVRISANLFSYVHLWYVKEYRFDRMLIHLKTTQVRRVYFIPFKVPLLTPKTITLVLFSSIGLALMFASMPLHILVRLFVMDVLAFPLVSLAVLLFKFPTIVYHEIVIFLAVQKLRRHSPMIVIGITGSYGKTSTKEFLATMVSTKYRVIKTEGSRNSPIAIAETILYRLKRAHEVFIVEMGAYKRGEIARMSNMTRPDIGIVTAINAQHQDLFGTIESTMKAKYELVQKLSGRKIAIFNADNAYTKKMMSWAVKDGREVWAYSLKNARHTVTASDIHSDLSGISFRVRAASTYARATASLVGEHQVSNILAAVSGALACGMDFKSAVQAVSRIKPVPKVMEVQQGINRSVFINDTFNNNPDAARAALDVLSQAKGGKYLVFQPMIELGSYADISHEEIGKYASKICDQIFLTNPNFLASFRKGAGTINPSIGIRVLTPHDTASALRKLLHKEDAVLFKGKEAEAVYQRLTH